MYIIWPRTTNQLVTPTLDISQGPLKHWCSMVLKTIYPTSLPPPPASLPPSLPCHRLTFSPWPSAPSLPPTLFLHTLSTPLLSTISLQTLPPSQSLVKADLVLSTSHGQSSLSLSCSTQLCPCRCGLQGLIHHWSLLIALVWTASNVTAGTTFWGMHQDGTEARGAARHCGKEEEGAPNSHQAASRCETQVCVIIYVSPLHPHNSICSVTPILLMRRLRS